MINCGGNQQTVEVLIWNVPHNIKMIKEILFLGILVINYIICFEVITEIPFRTKIRKEEMKKKLERLRNIVHEKEVDYNDTEEYFKSIALSKRLEPQSILFFQKELFYMRQDIKKVKQEISNGELWIKEMYEYF